MEAATLPATATPREETRQQIRGSSLLLVGRLLTVLLNFATQVLTVRYLSRPDYGAFAYAISLASLGTSLAVFGMDKSASRFLAIYQEQQDTRRAVGTLTMMTATVAAIGVLLLAGFLALRGVLAAHVIPDPKALTLCLVLAVTAPIMALESLFANAIAVFAGAKAVFFRRYLLGPLLELSVVVALIVRHADATFLAFGYLGASVISLAAYPSALHQVLRRQGLLKGLHLRDLIFPAREVFSFTLPMLSSDVVFLLRSHLIILLLGYFHPTTAVAAFRAVLPVARLNMLVFQSFMVLYTPTLARLYTRGDRTATNGLYWHTAGWIALVSFPLFAVTFVLAKPVTLLLFGTRYADAALLMSVLAFGHFLNAALGFNGQTLQTCGKVRFVALMDLVGAAISIAVSLALIPRWGAMGAAVATSVTLVLQNVLYQAGLGLAGVGVLDRGSAGIYGGITAATLLLVVLQAAFHPPIWIGLPLVAVVGLGLLRWQRRALHLEETFPELLRIPIVQKVLGG